MNHKAFSNEVFASNDPQSRAVVLSYMRQQGFDFTNNQDIYGVDLVSPATGLALELERRSIWVDPVFPFSEINIPERKGRILRNHPEITYVVVNKWFDRLAIVTGEKLQPYLERTYHNPNFSIKHGEHFFKVPVSTWCFVQVKT